MQVVVTDACIFIDLIELKITSYFFDLDIEVHTTFDVWNELYDNQQQLLKAYQSVGKLTTHILDPEDIEIIVNSNYPRGLSAPDKSVLYIAEKIDAILLSSDKAVRNFAKERAVNVHGMFWILDELVVNNLVSKELASSRLHELLTNNLMYNNNMNLWKEADKRFKLWK